MMRSLNSGVNGVQNHQIMMDVTGNNIANVNTIGFKSGRVSFADAISQTLASGQVPRTNRGAVNPIQVGLGMSVQSIDKNFGQGSMENTGMATDLAIQGRGFFIVSGGESSFYTRAGNFTLDSEGRLVAGNGFGIVQGRMADDSGEIINTGLTDITIPLQRKVAARATSEVQMYSNLDADATRSTASLTDAGNTGATVVNGMATDGLGGTHTISITGDNATASTTTSNATTLETTLEDIAGIGLTTVDDITVDVDNDGTNIASTVNITGLTGTNTVGDLLNQLNSQVPGVTFTFDAGTGVITATRDYAGDGSQYNFTLTDSGTGTIVADLFGNSGVPVDGGSASTLAAVDNFVDDATGQTISRTLEFSADANTGLMNELSGLGGGGVTISAPSGFVGGGVNAETLVIDTEATTHSTSITVYDEKGTGHNLSMTFTKSANTDQWIWEAEIGEPASALNNNSGTITFNPDGSLKSWDYAGGGTAFTFDPGDGENPVSIAFDVGTLGGMDGITQTSSSFSTSAVGQDGYAMGVLSNVDFAHDGRIVGNFTNGQSLTIGELVLADFANEQGLERAGSNMFSSTEASGAATLSDPETDLGSSIQAGNLEMSNVDITKEFTNMIKAQRGFQASARVITVSDQIMQEITTLKR